MNQRDFEEIKKSIGLKKSIKKENIKRYLNLRKVDLNDTFAQFVSKLNNNDINVE